MLDCWDRRELESQTRHGPGQGKEILLALLKQCSEDLKLKLKWSHKRTMMVGSNPIRKGTKAKGKGGARSGRTSPGLNVKRFTIPKKQKDLLNEVELESSEYIREVLPIIQQNYRDSNSKSKFSYVKVQLVHNSAIKKEFMEKKREMKDEGRNEKELTESYAFLFVDKEEEAKNICSQSLSASGIDASKKNCLGDPNMGVHLCRYSDIIYRNGFPQDGILLLFKILKGKVKAVVQAPGQASLEPTPNYDCHIAKNSADTAANHFKLFDSSQMFIFDFDQEEVEFRTRPRNICPYALVHFTYSESGASSSASQASSFNRKSATSSNESTPTRSISVPETASVAVVAPCFPRNDVATERPKQDKDRPFAEYYAEYLGRSYQVWSGHLLNKNGNSCRVSLVSFGLSFLPCQMPETLSSLKAVRIKELKLPSKIFTGSTPILSRVKEAQANGKFYWYAELHSLSLGDTVYMRFLNYLTDKDLVLKKELKESLLYIMPTGKTTHKLGLTSSSHPKMMHCLLESYTPMVSTLTDVCVKQPRHQQRPKFDSAPIHDIDKDHQKRLRFQSSLARLFYKQNVELKGIGVRGDEQVNPPPTPPIRRLSSVEVGDDQREHQVGSRPIEHHPGVPPLVWPPDDQRSNQQAVPHPSPRQQVVSHPSPHQQVVSHPSPHQQVVPHPSPHHVQQVPHQQASYGAGHYGDGQGVDHHRWEVHHSTTQQVDRQMSSPMLERYPGSQPLERQSSNHSMNYQPSPVQREHRLSQEPAVSKGSHEERHPLQQQVDWQPSNLHLESPESNPSPRSEHYSGRYPAERQSSNHSADYQQSPVSREHRLSQEQVASISVSHVERRPLNQTPPPPVNRLPSNECLESPESPPPADRRPGPWHSQLLGSNQAQPLLGHRLSERQLSNQWEDNCQSPARQDVLLRPKALSQDRSQLQAREKELPPQIKAVASKVHDILTGGMNLGLLPTNAATSREQVPRPETEDEKLARMRSTLKSLVEERERLVKRKDQVWKNSYNQW